jgi:CheY-like chemotaxis protein
MLEQTQTYPSERARDPTTALSVFVVENHEDTRTLLRLMLEMLGHRVVSARSMREALERLPAADCDVLISDIGLPDGDGWELMRRLQLPRPIYAVAISGYGMSSDRARSRSVGYRHHLVKPYGVERLPEILEEAANECSRRDSRRRADH